MTASLMLPPVLDGAAAAGLRSLLLAHRGRDLTLDGAAVERLGGLCLQVLLSARRTWEADGASLSIVHASEPLRVTADLAGAGPALGMFG